MSQQIPTTAELNTAIIAQLETAFGQIVPIFPKAFLRVIAKVLAAVLVIAYKYGGFIFLQQFVQFASTAETTINGKKVTPLIEWGHLVGADDPAAATRAEYIINITVTSQVGSLPFHTQLQNASNGVTYLTLAVVPLDAAVVQANIRAYSDQAGGGGKGSIGNLAVGDVVSFVSPEANVATNAAVASEVTRGADAEDWEVYRQRVIDRFRAQPQGGAPVDYEQWGETVPGIINVYPYKGDPGIVEVYSEATPESCGNADGIPTGGQLAAVLAAIELDDAGLASRRPISSFVESYAITRTGFSVVIAGVQGGVDLVGMQTRMIAAVTQYFLSRAPFISGLTLGARRDRITVSAVAGAVQDIADAYGAIFSGVVITENGVGTITIRSLGMGEKAKVTSVTFT